MSERVPAIKVLLLPKDTNAHGTIFGGVILSHIDLASAIEARTVAAHRLRDQGDAGGGVPRAGVSSAISCFYTELVRVGRTSVTMRVKVEAERWGSPPTRLRHDRTRGSVKVTRGGGGAGGGQRSGPAGAGRP